jgi:hypothetical protein
LCKGVFGGGVAVHFELENVNAVGGTLPTFIPVSSSIDIVSLTEKSVHRLS